MRRTITGLVLAGLLATGCQSDVGKQASDVLLDPDTATTDGPGPTHGATGAPTSTDPAFATEEPSPGTRRDRPLTIGTEATIDDWTLAVVGYDPDATDLVLEFNGQNDPPPDGHVFAMARLEATWHGDGSKNAFLAFEWALVDAGGNAWTDEGCGVLPDDLASQAEVPSSGTVAGTVCFVTASQVLDEVVLYVAPLMGTPESRHWWRAPPAGAGTVVASEPAQPSPAS